MATWPSELWDEASTLECGDYFLHWAGWLRVTRIDADERNQTVVVDAGSVRCRFHWRAPVLILSYGTVPNLHTAPEALVDG